MLAVRRLVRDHALFAFCILAAALLARALVPAGYMPAATLSLSICSGIEQDAAVHIVIPMKEDGRAKAKKGICDFTTFGGDMMAAADPLLIAAALLFILAAGLHPAAAPLLCRIPYLLPPQRGPPVA